jgi:hypothetical protein
VNDVACLKLTTTHGGRGRQAFYHYHKVPTLVAKILKLLGVGIALKVVLIASNVFFSVQVQTKGK